jgi:putative transposase
VGSGNAQSYVALYYHIIFSTRERRPSIDVDLQPRLYEYIGGILRNERGILMAAGGTSDHAHLLAALGRETALSDAVRTIKSNSSRWVHEAHPGKSTFAWQAGYGAFTVGRSGLENVKRYLAGQEEHHRTVTFQEEFLEFLHRYEIPFDERYIWE